MFAGFSGWAGSTRAYRQPEHPAAILDGMNHRCRPLSQNNCAALTNYTLAAPPPLNAVFNATGVVIEVTVARFFWCAAPGHGHIMGFTRVTARIMSSCFVCTK